MLPQGELMSGPVQVATSSPVGLMTSRQPSPLVLVVPSLLGVLPTMTQPVLSIVMAVVRPTPPGQAGRWRGTWAKSVVCLVVGL